MSILDKAFRLAQDVADPQRRDRLREAESRIEAGKQSLTALLYGDGVEVVLPASPTAQKVGQTLLELAPSFGVRQPQIRMVLDELEQAKTSLGLGVSLERIAQPLEQKLTGLLDAAGVSREAMPRDLLGDLIVKDETAVKAPKPGDKKANKKPEKKDEKKDATKPDKSEDKKCVIAMWTALPWTKRDAKALLSAFTGQVKAETKAETKVEMKAETRVDAKVEAKDDAKVEAKDDAKIEAKDDAKVEAKDDAKVEAKDDAKVEPNDAIDGASTRPPLATPQALLEAFAPRLALAPTVAPIVDIVTQAIDNVAQPLPRRRRSLSAGGDMSAKTRRMLRKIKGTEQTTSIDKPVVQLPLARPVVQQPKRLVQKQLQTSMTRMAGPSLLMTVQQLDLEGDAPLVIPELTWSMTSPRPLSMPHVELRQSRRERPSVQPLPKPASRSELISVMAPKQEALPVREVPGRAQRAIEPTPAKRLEAAVPGPLTRGLPIKRRVLAMFDQRSVQLDRMTLAMQNAEMSTSTVVVARRGVVDIALPVPPTRREPVANAPTAAAVVNPQAKTIAPVATPMAPNSKLQIPTTLERQAASSSTRKATEKPADLVSTTVDTTRLDERKSVAQQRLAGATPQNAGAIVDDELAMLQKVERDERRQIQHQQQMQQADQTQRKHKVQQRGRGAKTSTKQGATNRKSKTRQNKQSALAVLRRQFADYKQAQLERVNNLEAMETVRITQEMREALDAEKLINKLELDGTKQRITDEKASLVDTIRQGKELAETTRKEKEAELVTSHNSAVASARDEESKAIADATAQGNEAASGLRKTGLAEAQKARNAASSEAANLRAEGRRLAAQEQDKGKARSIAADYNGRASSRTAKGASDARNLIADYERQAQGVLDRMRSAIANHKTTTKTAIDKLVGDLATNKQTLITERDTWQKSLDDQLTGFETRAAIELAGAEKYFVAQNAAADKDNKDRFQQAIKAMQEDIVAKQATVQQEVTAKLNELQGALDKATEADVAKIQKDLGDAMVEIEKSVGKVQTSANNAIGQFRLTSQKRQDAMIAKGEETRAAISRMGDTARINIQNVNAQFDARMQIQVNRANASNQRTVSNLRDDLKFETKQVVETDAAKRQQNQASQDTSIERRTTKDTDADRRYETQLATNELANQANARNDKNWSTIDAEQSTRQALLVDQTYQIKRWTKTGEVAVTVDNVEHLRTTALDPSVRGSNNMANLMSTLGTKSPEEIKLIFANEAWTNEFLSNLGPLERAAIAELRRSGSIERIKAIAIKYAADGGLSVGTDDAVLAKVFNAVTDDDERKKLGSKFTEIDRGERSVEQLIRDEGAWINGKSRTDLMLAQYRGNEDEIAAYDTQDAYNGGWFGSGADSDRVLKVRNDIRKKFAGPYRSAEEAEDMRRQEQLALAKLDEVSQLVNGGQGIRDKDNSETTGPVRDALAETTKTTLVPSDPYDPDSPKVTVWQPDWVGFKAKVAESGAGSDYNTRRIEMAYADAAPAERKIINDRFAANNNGMTFEQYVNKNMGVTRTTDENGNVVETTDSRANLDRRSSVQWSQNGKLDNETAILQAEYGKGRGTEQDRAGIDRVIKSMTDDDLKKFKDSYKKLVEDLGMKQADWVTDGRRYADSASKYGMTPYSRLAGWVLTQVLDTTSGPTGDPTIDLRTTGSSSQNMLWQDILANGQADTPQKKQAQIDRLKQVMGPRPEKGSFGEFLEGNEGVAMRREWERLQNQLEGMDEADKGKTFAQSAKDLKSALESGMPAEEYQKKMKALEKFWSTADNAIDFQAATTEGKTATVSTIANVAGTTVTVIAGIAISFASGGTLTAPYITMVSAISGGLTTMGIKGAFANYDRREFMADAASTIVDAVSAGVLSSKGLNKFANTMVKRLGVSPEVARGLLADVLLETASGAISELAKALLDERTYQGTPDEIRQRLIKRVSGATMSSGVGSGVNSGGNALIKSGKPNVFIGMTAGVIGALPTAENPLDFVLGGLSGAGDAFKDRVGSRSSNDAQTSPVPGMAVSKTRSGIVVARHQDGTFEVAPSDYARYVKELFKDARRRGLEPKIAPDTRITADGLRTTTIELGSGKRIEITTRDNTSGWSHKTPIELGGATLNKVALGALANTTSPEERQSLLTSMGEVYAMVKQSTPGEVAANPAQLGSLIQYHLAIANQTLREGNAIRKIVQQGGLESLLQGFDYRGKALTGAKDFIGDARNTESLTTDAIVDMLGLDYNDVNYLRRDNKGQRSVDMMYIVDIKLDASTIESFADKARIPMAPALYDAIKARAESGDAAAQQLLGRIKSHVSYDDPKNPYTGFGMSTSGPRRSPNKDRLSLNQEYTTVLDGDTKEMKQIDLTEGSTLKAKMKSGYEITIATWHIDESTSVGGWVIEKSLPAALREKYQRTMAKQVPLGRKLPVDNVPMMRADADKAIERLKGDGKTVKDVENDDGSTTYEITNPVTHRIEKRITVAAPTVETTPMGGGVTTTADASTLVGTNPYPSKLSNHAPLQIAGLWKQPAALTMDALDKIWARFEQMGSPARFPANRFMMDRLRQIVRGDIRGTETDRMYFEHEKLEGDLMEQGYSYEEAHLMAIEMLGFGHHPYELYDVASGIYGREEITRETNMKKYDYTNWQWKPEQTKDYTDPANGWGVGRGEGFKYLPKKQK